jgi:GNAT superfamily N-acetyltransferase
MTIYENTFREGERESRRAFEDNLASEGNEKSGGHIILALLDREARCRGGIIFSYLEIINSGYISYLVVERSLRRLGHGSALFWAAKDTLDFSAHSLGHPSVHGIFAELERESLQDPLTYDRLRFWENLGVLPLDFSWAYPELIAGKTPVPMDLAYRGFGTHRQLTHASLCAATEAIFRSTYSYLPGCASVLETVRHVLTRYPPATPIPFRSLRRSQQLGGAIES